MKCYYTPLLENYSTYCVVILSCNVVRQSKVGHRSNVAPSTIGRGKLIYVILMMLSHHITLFCSLSKQFWKKYEKLYHCQRWDEGSCSIGPLIDVFPAYFSILWAVELVHKDVGSIFILGIVFQHGCHGIIMMIGFVTIQGVFVPIQPQVMLTSIWKEGQKISFWMLRYDNFRLICRSVSDHHSSFFLIAQPLSTFLYCLWMKPRVMYWLSINQNVISRTGRWIRKNRDFFCLSSI